jgi:hypothetical protein
MSSSGLADSNIISATLPAAMDPKRALSPSTISLITNAKCTVRKRCSSSRRLYHGYNCTHLFLESCKGIYNLCSNVIIVEGPLLVLWQKSRFGIRWQTRNFATKWLSLTPAPCTTNARKSSCPRRTVEVPSVASHRNYNVRYIPTNFAQPTWPHQTR